MILKTLRTMWRSFKKGFEAGKKSKRRKTKR